MYPVAALIIAVVALPIITLGGPRLWRAGVLAVRAVDARLRGFFGTKGWRNTGHLPGRARSIVMPAELGRPQPRVLRAALKGIKGVGPYKNGWIVLSDEAPVFVYLSLLGARRLALPVISQAELRRGLWADTVEIDDAGAKCTVFLLKDGPPAEIALAGLKGNDR